MAEQIILKTGGEGYYEEKKSRFLAKTYSVASENEAEEYINGVRKEYWDARHNCYAYRIGAQGQLCRSSDDGEPSGTAGKPIMEVLNGCNVTNCLCIVTRYFGGTLLGTGGLVRAYQKSAKEALLHSRLAVLVPGERYTVITDYTGVGKLQYLIPQYHAQIINTVYGEKVVFTVDVAKSGSTALLAQITEGTAGKALIQKETDLEMETPYLLEAAFLD